MSQLRGLITLTRPVNVVISAASIFMGAFITGTIQPIAKVALACLSGSIIAGAANVINDYFDIEIDKINKQHRPLPSGLVTPPQARIFSILLFATGIIIGALVNSVALAIAASSSVLLFMYSASLKRTVLWGNLAVSLATALAFIYGGIAVGRFSAALIPAGFAFMFHWGREIIKDIEDMEGDRENHVKTLPIRYGEKIALGVATGVFCVLLFATIVPYSLKIYGLLYLLIVLFGVDTVLVYVIFSMWKNPQPANLGWLSTLLKIDMIIGLVAIYAGR